MVKGPRAVDFEPIDRLEEKVKLLVALIERTRKEQARTAQENERLKSELEALRGRVADAAQADSEVTTLRAEREQIRTRVTGLLERLETIDL